MKKISAGIVGGAGYTGGELVRLLLNHPYVELVSVSSRSQAGKALAEQHEDLLGQTALTFTETCSANVDVAFLCLPHGRSREYLAGNPFPAGTLVIDLSNDHRLSEQSDGFVYGLPEINRPVLENARRIANPGCFATAIELALLPVAATGLLNGDVHVSAITGSTGAGLGLQPTTHFTWRNNNMSVYKAFRHQHLGEIGETLAQLQPGFKGQVRFIPYRGNYSRGIIASVYLPFEGSAQQAGELFREYYRHAVFTKISPANPHLKQVVNTNYCFLHTDVHDGQLLVISILDNLLKGASGQAVQNMNIALGWPEDTGLRLKASVF